MAGLYRFYLLRICCSGYGTVEMVKGWSALFFIFFILLLVLLVCGCLWWDFVLLYGFSLVISGTICGFVCYELLIFFLFVTGGTGRVGTWRTRSLCWSRRTWSTEGWTSRLALRSWSPMFGTWRTTTWCWRMETRKTRFFLRFAAWIVRSSSWRLSWLLWLACCPLIIRRLFGVEWCVSGLIWVVFIIFLLVQFWFDFLF